jgi:hypothetical protein
MKEIALMEKLAKYRNEFLKLNVMIHRCDDAECKKLEAFDKRQEKLSKKFDDLLKICKD